MTNIFKTCNYKYILFFCQFEFIFIYSNYLVGRPVAHKNIEQTEQKNKNIYIILCK